MVQSQAQWIARAAAAVVALSVSETCGLWRSELELVAGAGAGAGKVQMCAGTGQVAAVGDKDW